MQPSVREVLEDREFASGDPVLERLGEARGADDVVGSESDQGRSVDLAEYGARVVGDGRIGLRQERVHGLGGAAAHEVRQRVDELRPFDVHLRCEAPREDGLDDHVGDGRQRRCERTPLLEDDLQIGIAGVPAAVQRERAHAAGMAGGQVDAHRPAERHARHVRPFDPDRAQEGGNLVGVAVGRVRPGRLVALARAGKVDRDAAEVLGVRRQLERVAGVVRGRVRDQQERLALPLHLVVDREPVHLNLRHARSLLAVRRRCRSSTPSIPRSTPWPHPVAPTCRQRERAQASIGEFW